MKRTILLTLALISLTTTARGDAQLFSYDGDVFPDDPAGEFVVANACSLDCSRRLENGHFILEWGVMGDLVTYSNDVVPFGDPPPSTLWVEWRFRSNQPFVGGSPTCDGKLRVNYLGTSDTAYMLQDAVFDFEGGGFVLGLDPDTFHTYRFESLDGNNHTLAVDGAVFKSAFDTGGMAAFVQFGGIGSCIAGPERPVPVRNEWDYVRYGTIESGEAIIATVPPTGVIADEDAAGVTSILVTFDGPNYAYVDDISVSVTSGVAPNVIATRRLDNGSSDVLEVVLDSELPLNVTTTLTFTNIDGNPIIVFKRISPDIPAASTWGLIALAIGIAIAGTLLNRRTLSRWL